MRVYISTYLFIDTRSLVVLSEALPSEARSMPPEVEVRVTALQPSGSEGVGMRDIGIKV